MAVNIKTSEIRMAEKKESNKMKLNNHDVKVSLLEQSVTHINQTLICIESKIDSIDKKFDEKIDTNFRWLIGMIISGFVSTWVILSHIFHWL